MITIKKPPFEQYKVKGWLCKQFSGYYFWNGPRKDIRYSWHDCSWYSTLQVHKSAHRFTCVSDFENLPPMESGTAIFVTMETY